MQVAGIGFSYVGTSSASAPAGDPGVPGVDYPTFHSVIPNNQYFQISYVANATVRALK
jgi:hypothetical protein